MQHVLALLAESRLQSQIGMTATPKEATWAIILALLLVVALGLKKLLT